MGWTYSVEQLAEVVGAPAPASGIKLNRVSTDTRTLEKGDLFIALSGERFDGNAFVGEAFAKGAAAAVTTAPNDAGPCLVVEDPLDALQRFAAWHRKRYTLPLIAITGSCGKTSSKDLIAAVLETRYTVAKTAGNLNNEIGCPLSLLNIDGETERAVLELGANHAGEIAALCKLAHPSEAAITNVAPAHLDGFGSVEGVAKAKGEIAEALPDSGTFYVNLDDPWCRSVGESFGGKKIYYGGDGDLRMADCRFDQDGLMILELVPLEGPLRLPLYARAHAHNVMLAVAIGLEHGIEDFQEALYDACLSSARFKVESIGGLDVIDDSYNANPSSMAAALEGASERASKGRFIAVLGDMLELGGEAERFHREAGAEAARLGAGHVFARGTFAQAVVDGALDGGAAHAETVDDHESMAHAVRRVAKPGDVILIKGSRGMAMEKVIEALRRLATEGREGCARKEERVGR